MNYKEHFAELKKRVLFSLLFFLAALGVAYLYSSHIYEFLLAPLAKYYQAREIKGNIIYTNLAEAFFTYLKLSFWSAMFLSFPFVMTQVYLFMAPGLYKHEKSILVTYMVLSPILFILGAFTAYYYIFPTAWEFFLSFENHTLDHLSIKLESRISEYLSISMQIIMAFGIAFQLPVFITLLNKIGLIEVATLKSNRRIAIVLIFIIAAVLTPPDVLSQVILAIIMIILYELSILGCI